MTVRKTYVGELVEWNRGGADTLGVVVSLPRPVDYDVDELTGRPSGASVAQFGELAGVRCTDLACQCNVSDWTHAVNEIQLRPATVEFFEVPLW